MTTKIQTRSYSVSEARKHWAKILDAVEHGEEVTITKYGDTVASIIPPGRKKQKPFPAPGFLAKEGWHMEMADDFDAIPEGFEDYV